MADLSNKDFDFIYSKVPRACIDLLVKTKNGFVLVKREDPPEVGTWHMPGGGVKFQETLEEATKRIAKRELGIEIEPGKILGYDEYLHEPRYLGEAHSIGIILEASIVGGDLEEKIKEGKVSVFETLPEDTLSTHRRALEKILSSRF